MMIIMVILFFINIVWACWNWKREWSRMTNAIRYKQWKEVPIAAVCFFADLGITTSATAIFGFGGFYGSAMALFMSNVMSYMYFTPKRQQNN